MPRNQARMVASSSWARRMPRTGCAVRSRSRASGPGWRAPRAQSPTAFASLTPVRSATSGCPSTSRSSDAAVQVSQGGCHLRAYPKPERSVGKW